ncbi:MAG: hypothetical protein AB1898_14260 [Acidobacteriota bacterium]
MCVLPSSPEVTGRRRLQPLTSHSRMLGLALVLVATASLIRLTPMVAQSLADAARKERERRSQDKRSGKVYTNDDLGRYGGADTSPSVNPPAPLAQSDPLDAMFQKMETSEREWSQKFIEARNRIDEARKKEEELQNKLNDYSFKLLNQSDVYDRENLYGPLIAQTRQEIEKNKEEMASANRVLEDLREALRKSGHPASWENSQAALTAPSESASEAKPKAKDQDYWKEQLSVIDKRYESLIGPLQSERFQLINRRPLAEGESGTAGGGSGLGLPPRVVDIDVKIKELTQKHQQERDALIERALREGALPGWFR